MRAPVAIFIRLANGSVLDISLEKFTPKVCFNGLFDFVTMISEVELDSKSMELTRWNNIKEKACGERFGRGSE